MLKQCLWAVGIFAIFQASLWTREMKYGKSKNYKKRIISHSLNREVSLIMAGIMFFVVRDEPATIQMNEYSIVVSAIIIAIVGLILGFLNYAFTYWSQMKENFLDDKTNCKFHYTLIIINVIVLICGFTAILFFAK